MPHVASQVIDKKPSHERWTKKQALSMERRSSDFQRPVTPVQRQRRPLNRQMPNLSLLVTSPNDRLDTVPTRHARKASEFSPISAVDTVFDLPSAGSYEQTPNSSIHSYAVELEDTSPNPFATRQTGSELSKSPGVSIKTHGSSAPLHQNSVPTTDPDTPARSLRSSKPRTYPKSTAVTKAEIHLDLPRRSSRSQCAPKPVSVVVTSPPHDQLLPPLPLNSPANIKSRAAKVIEAITAIEEDNRQLLDRVLAAEQEAKTLQEANISLQQRIAYCDQYHHPRTTPSRRAASETTPISTFNTTPTRPRPPPLNLTPTHPISSRRQARPQASISAPIPSSVIRQQITYKGAPISYIPPVDTISLDEARRREKPLPFITPLSPSMVPGFVEMGGRVEVCAGEKMGMTRKKTFGDLFWWGRKAGV